MLAIVHNRTVVGMLTVISSLTWHTSCGGGRPEQRASEQVAPAAVSALATPAFVAPRSLLAEAEPAAPPGETTTSLPTPAIDVVASQIALLLAQENAVTMANLAPETAAVIDGLLSSFPAENGAASGDDDAKAAIAAAAASFVAKSADAYAAFVAQSESLEPGSEKHAEWKTKLVPFEAPVDPMLDGEDVTGQVEMTPNAGGTSDVQP